jgi:hypothetical protein
MFEFEIATTAGLLGLHPRESRRASRTRGETVASH